MNQDEYLEYWVLRTIIHIILTRLNIWYLVLYIK